MKGLQRVKDIVLRDGNTTGHTKSLSGIVSISKFCGETRLVVVALLVRKSKPDHGDSLKFTPASSRRVRRGRLEPRPSRTMGELSRHFV